MTQADFLVLVNAVNWNNNNREILGEQVRDLMYAVAELVRDSAGTTSIHPFKITRDKQNSSYKATVTHNLNTWLPIFGLYTNTWESRGNFHYKIELTPGNENNAIDITFDDYLPAGVEFSGVVVKFVTDATEAGEWTEVFDEDFTNWSGVSPDEIPDNWIRWKSDDDLPWSETFRIHETSGKAQIYTGDSGENIKLYRQVSIEAGKSYRVTVLTTSIDVLSDIGVAVIRKHDNYDYDLTIDYITAAGTKILEFTATQTYTGYVGIELSGDSANDSQNVVIDNIKFEVFE